MEKTEIAQRLIQFRQVVEEGIELPSDEIELSLANTLAGVCDVLGLDPEQTADVVGYIGYNDTPIPFTFISSSGTLLPVVFEAELALAGA